MAYLALYRKYRPTSFNDVYGQEEIVTVIKHAIIENKISHAYLFCGPRGTGKTTIAKIIARLINCENLIDGNPCGKCYNCMNFSNSNDVVEIDAASNNGVNEIRELRDKVNLVPSNAKYKVYIIDEVHMLTPQAFNALLKTLEEPPSHAIFILATTEPHKIPLTIASRCQKFRFSKIDDEKIVNRLKEIAKIENFDVEEDAFFEMARISDGCMRDAINILDQLAAYSESKITMSDISKVIGTTTYDELVNLLTNIVDNNKENIITFIDYLDKNGKDVNRFVQETIVFLKDIILYKNTNILGNIKIKNNVIMDISKLFNDRQIYNLIDTLNDIQNAIKFSSHSSIILMTYLLKYSDEEFGNELKIISREIIRNKINMETNKNTDKKKSDKENISREIILNVTNDISDDIVDVRINNAFALASKEIKKDFENRWHELDNFMSDEEFSLISGLLKDAFVVVASKEYIIISSLQKSIVNRINENLTDAEHLLKKIFEYDIKAIAISNDRWLVEKKKYIENIKNGVKYSVKVENNINNSDSNSNSNKFLTPVDELIELVGDSVIEYK